MLKSVTKVLAGSVFAQGLTILILPLLSRLYTPAEYGTYGLVMVVVGISSVLATFQLHHAIVLPKHDSHSFALFSLSSYGALAGGVFIFVCGFAYSIYNQSDYFLYPVMVGLAVAVTGLGQSVQGLAIRSKGFSYIGLASVLRVAFMATIQVTFGIFGAGAYGLLLGYIIGEVIVIGTLWKFAIPKLLKQVRRVSLVNKFALIKRYRSFVTYGTAQEVMNSASQGLPVIILGAYFSQAVVGYYSFANRILLSPVESVANAVRQVLSQRFAVNIRVPSLIKSDFKFATIFLALPALLCVTFLMPRMADVFSFIFGEAWRESGNYGGWLIIWLAFVVFNVPSTMVLRTLKRQKESFILNFLILITRAICLIWTGVYSTPIFAVMTFSLLGVFWNLVYIGLAWYFISKLGNKN